LQLCCDKAYERGPDGVEISHLYDAAGRARSESRTFTDEAGQRRTLTTQYRYDDKGRLVETIDHANRTTRTEYNAIDWAEDWWREARRAGRFLMRRHSVFMSISGWEDLGDG
jgi:YD repeat-containing protein